MLQNPEHKHALKAKMVQGVPDKILDLTTTDVTPAIGLIPAIRAMVVDDDLRQPLIGALDARLSKPSGTKQAQSNSY